jgi:type I restriction enzyme, S subunit
METMKAMATPKDDKPANRPLPEGWAWVTLEECVDILDNRRIPINSEEREQRIAGREQSELYPYYGATGLVGWIDDFIFDEEIVLLGEDGAPFLESKNKAYLVRGKCWVNNHAHVLRAKKGVTTNLYLMHYLNIFDYHGYVTGTTRLKLNQGRMREFPVILPPLAEQERIVRRLEELLSDLEAGVQALGRVRAGVKRYKASVLKAACEGRLFDAGEQGMRPFEEVGATRRVAPTEAGGLPEGWRWVTIGELTEHLTSGSRGWAKYYAESGSLFVRVGNFNRISRTIDLDKAIFVKAPSGAEANRTRLQLNDLLITMTADVGMVGIVDESTLHWGDAYINQHVGLARLREPEYVEFVAYALASEIGQKQFREKQYGATKLGLNFEDIKSLEIPLPPLEEQRRIVAEVERRLEAAREVEAAVDVGVKRARRLRQAVLRNAFEGRLR